MKEIDKIFSGTEPIRWIFAGDSITHGALHTFGFRDYSELFSERVRSEMRKVLDVVIKTAVSGTTTRHALENYENLIGQFLPGVVFIMYGMNDCANKKIPPDEFRKNLETLVDKIRSAGGIPILQTTCPILPNCAPERGANLDEYMDIIRTVASAKTVVLIDHNAYWKSNSEQAYYWMSNAFHPNGFGHLAFAKLIFKELGIYDEKSNTCKLFFPS
ncbi:MAG TPA: SGNH/GDSL hydrolase family protein [Victivallales bacterium]|nr:SGNH/GDSL hydrolase family protein [Victivallales bacterium]